MLEEGLNEAKVPVLYPLEGYSSQPASTAGPELLVLAPPYRMIRTLLTTDDIAWLVTPHPTPLGWLLDSEKHPGEQPYTHTLLDNALRDNALTPDTIPSEMAEPGNLVPTEEDLPSRLARIWGMNAEQEPEFFGDSLLNNCSLVLWMRVNGGFGRGQRVLLTGDQENWTYLLGRHPMGLQADVLKAVHHGGRMYIESAEAAHEVLSTVRPRAVLISANGEHGLPRSITRRAAITWGASVFCTSCRTREVVTGPTDTEDASCCHEGFTCEAETRDVTLHLNNGRIWADRVACHSGRPSDPGPVIQIAQHVIAPSPVLSRLFENELRDHLRWVKKILDQVHQERLAAAQPNVEGSRPVDENVLLGQARRVQRDAVVGHLETILKRGMQQRLFWAQEGRSYPQKHWQFYHWPSPTETQSFISMLRDKSIIVFAPEVANARSSESGIPVNDLVNRDSASVLARLNSGRLAALADLQLRLPTAAFEDTLWPHVVDELTRRWHAFIHGSGYVLFSRIDSAAPLHDIFTNALTIDQKLWPYGLLVLMGSSDTKDISWSNLGAVWQILSKVILTHMSATQRAQIDPLIESWNQKLNELFSILRKIGGYGHGPGEPHNLDKKTIDDYLNFSRDFKVQSTRNQYINSIIHEDKISSLARFHGLAQAQIWAFGLHRIW
jgi:hypothetical protein